MSVIGKPLLTGIRLGSASGPTAYWKNGIAGPLRSLEVNINPVQDTHGYAPRPAGAGPNLIPDGTDTSNGYVAESYLDENNAPEASTNFYVSEYFAIDDTKTYTWSDSTGAAYNAGICFYDENKAFISGVKAVGIMPYTFTPPAGAKYCRSSQTYINNNSTKFQLEEGNTATPYVPYSNVCPINAVSNAQIYYSNSTNLFNQDTLLQGKDWVKAPSAIPEFNGVPTYYGTLANLASTSRPFNSLLPVDFDYKLNTRYRITWWWRRYNPSTSAGLRVKISYTDGTSASSSTQANNTTDFIRYSTTTAANKTVSKLALTYNTSSNVYLAGFAIEEINGSQAPTTAVLPSMQVLPSISWQEAGTVYGGTLNVTNGVLTVNRAMVDLGTISWVSHATVANVYTGEGKNLPRWTRLPAAGVADAICSAYVLATSAGTSGGVGAIDFSIALGTGSSTKIYVHDSTASGIADFRLKINGVQLVYELATPIEYTLTPTQISSLYGENNIWADCGDTAAEFVHRSLQFIS